MNCTALSVTHSISSASYRRSGSSEIANTREQLRIAKFLKNLLKSRLWLLRSKNEEHASLMQSYYTTENQSMLTNLEYAKAVDDLQTCGIMKHFAQSRLQLTAVTAQILWHSLIKSNGPHVNELRDIDFDAHFLYLRKKSHELQIKTKEIEVARQEVDDLQLKFSEGAARIVNAVKITDSQQDTKSHKVRSLSQKVRKIRIMQSLISNLIASVKHLDDEKFELCYELTERIGPQRSWKYYVDKCSDVVEKE